MAELMNHLLMNHVFDVVAIVVTIAAVFGLILWLALLMDKLDARFGAGGFAATIALIATVGWAGGWTGWRAYHTGGAFVGAYLGLAGGVAVLHAVFRRTETGSGEDG